MWCATVELNTNPMLNAASEIRQLMPLVSTPCLSPRYSPASAKKNKSPGISGIIYGYTKYVEGCLRVTAKNSA